MWLRWGAVVPIRRGICDAHHTPVGPCPWLVRDRAPFAELNCDQRVINPPMLPAETDQLVDHFNHLWRTDGFGFAAAERKSDGLFVGMIGLQRFAIDPTVPACVEIGWRLPHALWGQGYATEAAYAWLDYGFDRLDLPEIVAFTDDGNSRSQAVMRRLTMVREPARDSIHPEFGTTSRPSGSTRCSAMPGPGDGHLLQPASPVDGFAQTSGAGQRAIPPSVARPALQVPMNGNASDKMRRQFH